MEWLQTPALLTGLGILAWNVARALVVLVGLVLTVASPWMKPSTAKRVREATETLAVLVLALRGKAPPVESGAE